MGCQFFNMGAGATSGVENIVADTAMKEVFEGLGEDARKAFWEVVAKDGVEAAINSDEAVKEAFGKLSEDEQTKFKDDVKGVYGKEEPAADAAPEETKEAEAAPEEAKEETKEE